MKKIAKMVIFLLIFTGIWNYVFDILGLIKNSISYFYDEPRNSLDVVYIGSSNANTAFNTVLAYNEYGFTTGMLSTESQSFINVKHLIIEAEKYQNPEVYIIDIAKLADDLRYIAEDTRKTVDSMKFSANRFNAINELLQYTNIPKNEYINYYFSYLLYHNQWKNISVVNFHNYENWWDIYYKGFLFNSFTAEIEPQEKFIWSNESFELQEPNKSVLFDLINYIKENDLKVLFVLPARYFWFPELEMLSDSIKFLKDENFNVLNFNELDDFELDYNSDFYNESHINIYGATKYTLYLSKYLKNNYNLVDHRNDKMYKSWDKIYDKFKDDFYTTTKKDYQKLVNKYKKDYGF